MLCVKKGEDLFKLIYYFEKTFRQISFILISIVVFILLDLISCTMYFSEIVIKLKTVKMCSEYIDFLALSFLECSLARCNFM